MNARFLLGAILVTAVAAESPAQPRVLSDTTRSYVSVEAPVVAITRVTVIDGTGAGPRGDQTVVITNGRISAVGASGSVSVPQGARTIDGTGHTLIPGLVGMHDHTFYTTAAGRRSQLNTSAPRLYLASGVTTIRTTGSISPYSEITLKDQVDKGKVPGPRMHISGPYLTGPDDVVERMHITTPAQARRVVNYWADEGATWFKVYTEISRENLRAITDAAHQRGVKVTGHLCSVGYKEAVEANIDALEHGLMANLEYVPGKKVDTCPGMDRETYLKLDVNGPAVQSTFKAMIAKGVPMTSTLAVYEISVPNRPPLDPRVTEAMSPEVQREYMATRERLAGNTSALPLQMLKQMMAYEMAFVKAGGTLAAGVDPTGNGGALPGFGDQRNYELLIEAGFTPGQVVQIMAANGARVLGVDRDLGTISSGRIADLVLLRGDLAANPAAIRDVVTVFKDGVGYDSQKLIRSVKGLVGVR